MTSGETIHINGSYGEGGGQILRTALTLAILLQRPVHIDRIRAGRTKPGLAPQHLACLRAAAAISGAEISGDRIGSQEAFFEPGTVSPGDYRFDIGTAGSTSLLFHTIFLPLATADGSSCLTLIGGTHVPWSPCTHYLQEVYLPVMARMGIESRIDLERWGWYPRGGGIVRVEIDPVRKLDPLGDLRASPLRAIAGFSAVSNLPDSIAERERGGVIRSLRGLDADIDVRIERGPSIGEGTAVFLHAETEDGVTGFTSLGRRGKKAEEVGREAGEALLDFLRSGASVDTHLADQLILPMAITGPGSSFTTPVLTSHLRTVLWLVEQFLPGRFEIIEEENVLVKRTPVGGH